MRLREYLLYLLLLVFRPSSPKTMEWRMLRLLNNDRRSHGLDPVFMQDDLRAVARAHSRDMARKDYFDHVNLTGEKPSDRLVLSGISDVISGENLAKIGGHRNQTQVAQIGLMNSPGHRANILESRFNTVGVGVVRDQRGVYYFTQNFAHRDLVFRKKIPLKAGLARGIFLSGTVFTDVRHVYYRITNRGTGNVVKEGGCDVVNWRFRLHLHFPAVGPYEVFFYVDHEGLGQHTLANRFNVKVKRFFLQLF